MGFIIPALGVLGSLIKGFFGFRSQQASTVQTALQVLSDVSASQGQREQATAFIIAAEANSGYWLAACWRPMFMVIFMVIIVSFWFGYTPPYLTMDMPPMISRIFDIIEVAIMGYIPARSIDKLIQQLNLGSILKALINKGI